MKRYKTKKRYYGSKPHQYNEKLEYMLFCAWSGIKSPYGDRCPGLKYAAFGAVIYVNGAVFDIAYTKNGVLQSVPHTEDFYRHIDYKRSRLIEDKLSRSDHSVVVVGVIMDLDNALSAFGVLGIDNIKHILSSGVKVFKVHDILDSKLEDHYFYPPVK